MDRPITEIHEAVYSCLTEELKDKNLRVSLRVKNRNGRLDEGYWFKGNENYLTFSFWLGLDWRSKLSNISIIINKGGDSSLTFIALDDEEKRKFFAQIAEPLGLVQRKRVRSGQSYDIWEKSYGNKHYLDAIKEFITRDKVIIDAFIKSERLENLFQPIDSDTFRTAKERIEEKRAKFKRDKTHKTTSKSIQSIQLTQLQLDNIGIFAGKTRVEFGSNVTCFLGLNGTGKTSLLRSIVLGFTGYETNEKLSSDEIIADKLLNLLRIDGVSKTGAKEYPSEGGSVRLDYKIQYGKGEAKDFHNRTMFRLIDDKPRIEDDADCDFETVFDDKYYALFLAFPQVQGDKLKKAENSPAELAPNISDTIAMLNDQPDNRFDAVRKWLLNLYMQYAEKQVKGETSSSELKLIDKMFEIVSRITGEPIRRYDIFPSQDEVWVCIGEGGTPILLDLVSQGYNNILGWIGYFMKRLLDKNPKAADFTQTPAIVLVDEIDTYLHPKWQAQILAILVEQFPNVQFVVTTHSPYIVGSIPKDKIRIYICEKSGKGVAIDEFTEFNTYGAELGDLSERLFGVDERFVDDVRQRFKELSDLIYEGELSEAEAYFNNKFTDIDPEDAELVRYRMIINTKKMLGK